MNLASASKIADIYHQLLKLSSLTTFKASKDWSVTKTVFLNIEPIGQADICQSRKRARNKGAKSLKLEIMRSKGL